MTARTRLTVVSTVYWLLLIYIVAALVWWFVSLEQQNRQMADLRLQQLSASTWEDKQQKEAAVLDLKRRKTAQYIGEGGIFMLLILVGAVYIFRATRRQLLLGQQQQNFMMAVTHELKTPIAITTLNLETLQKRKLDDYQQQRILTNSLQETNRLNDLCNNILLTAQLETGQSNTATEEIDLSTLVQECVSRFRSRYPTRVFHFTTVENASVEGESFMLQMLVNNLLENAVKYSPKDSPVATDIKNENGKVMLEIADGGPGIPDAEKKKVFQKFYRIGDERTRTSKGTGLGLYLCRRIMRNHKGDLRLTDNVPKGSIFTATFRT